MLGEKLMMLRKKQGYTQQEVAEMLSISRQTISNWESDQGAPSLDKALELAQIYKVSLDDLAEDQVKIITKMSHKKDNHILEMLVGKTVKLVGSNIKLLPDNHHASVKILEVSEDWLRIEYTRTKENTLFQKENVKQLIDLSLITGFELLEEEEA